jgi:hypothetical protein|tara:strand:- start:2291 stop:2557 length:267 start_codon:yes stop_codon:yes gene_type:complete
MDSFIKADDLYVKNYIAQINTEHQTKCLEVLSLKARVDVLNTQVQELALRLQEYEPPTTEEALGEDEVVDTTTDVRDPDAPKADKKKK